MKCKLLIFLGLCLGALLHAQAQHKFYVGASGGLNEVFSQTKDNNEFYRTTSKGGHQLGFRTGFTFASDKAQIETGVIFDRYNMLFDSDIGFDDYPDFYLSYNPYQIPVYFKFTLTQPHQKFKIYNVIGISFIENLSSYDNTRIGFEKNPTFNPDTTYNYTHAGLPAEVKVDIRVNSSYRNNKSSGFLYKAGLGASYKITDRFEIDAVGMFQMGTTILFAADADYIHRTQVRPYIWQRTITATSKADGLTFNVGVNYHFGKRRPKE